MSSPLRCPTYQDVETLPGWQDRRTECLKGTRPATLHGEDGRDLDTEAISGSAFMYVV